MRRVFFITLAFIVFPTQVFGADFAYGTLSLPNGKDAVVRMRTLETYTDYVCNRDNFGCANMGTSTLSFTPLVFAGRDVLMSPDGNAAVVRGPVNMFHRISSGVPDQGTVVPVAGRIDRVFFLEKNDTLLVFANKEAHLLNMKTGGITYTAPFVPSGKSFLTPSPNGRYLAYYKPATVSSQEREYAVLSLRTKRTFVKKEKIAYWDLMSEETRLFQWSPDSTRLYMLNDRSVSPALYEVNVPELTNGTLVSKKMFSKSYTVADFLARKDGYLYFTANRDNPSRWDLYRYHLRNQTLEVIARNVSYASALKEDEKYVYFNRLTEWGSEPVAYDPGAKALRTFSLPHPTFSLATGTRIAAGAASAVLYKPDGWTSKQAYPLVVWLHGGPYRHVSLGFNSLASYGTYDWMLENLRRSGAVVLKLDYRGSYGYGREFAEGLRANVGVKDVADVFAAVAAAKKAAKVDNVYLAGVSYGGYLALRTIVEKPAQFAGAASINGVTEWQGLVEKIPSTIFRIHFNGVPSRANMAVYNKASITERLMNLGNQKILLIGSEADTEVPYSQTTNMNALLAENGKNVEFVSYPGEGHVLKYRKTAEDVCRQLFRFTGLSGEEKCSLAPAGAESDQGIEQGEF